MGNKSALLPLKTKVKKVQAKLSVKALTEMSGTLTVEGVLPAIKSECEVKSPCFVVVQH